jgi:hypothetical protein
MRCPRTVIIQRTTPPTPSPKQEALARLARAAEAFDEWRTSTSILGDNLWRIIAPRLPPKAKGGWPRGA